MDGTRPQQPLTDSQLDRELEMALGVAPSPDFLARVRTRIVDEPETPAWRLADVVFGFSRAVRTRAVEPLWAVAILGIVLTIVVPRWMRDEPPRRRPAIVDVRLPSAQRIGVKLGSAGTAPDARGRAPAARGASRPNQVEVIVSRDEQQALQALIRVTYEGRMPALPEAARETVIDVPDLIIAPLVIDRLPQIARIETEGENRW